MRPEMNRTHYSTDEEEFDLNEGFVEPYSIILNIFLIIIAQLILLLLK